MFAYHGLGGEKLKSFSNYDEDKVKDAEEIDVSQFRQILIWPLGLADISSGDDPADARHVRDKIDAQARRIDQKGKPWVRLKDPLEHAMGRNAPSASGEKCPPNLSDEDKQKIHAEFVYFHDFVQSFLYALPDDASENKKNNPAGAFHLFTHSTLEGVKIELPLRGQDCLLEFKVDRCNLYLFATGVAILALEISGVGANAVRSLGKNETEPKIPRNMALDDVQCFIDLFRRAYVPFWWDPETGGLIPKKVTWCAGLQQIPDYAEGKRPVDGMKLAETWPVVSSANSKRVAPVFGHWQQLLPLTLSGYEKKANDGLVFKHIVDERIPSMLFLSVTGASGMQVENWQGQPAANGAEDLRTVEQGDWMRLCFADSPDKAPTPYNPDFLADFEEEHCYDRFYPYKGSDAATRQMFSGYAYAMVGAGWFFDNVLIEHFRRHYFQMALIANFELASLLSYSNEVSEAVCNDDPSREGGTLGNTIHAIQRRFLQFTHRFHFTGISNQVQANEMFLLWRRHLALDGITKDISDELKSAADFQFASEQAEQTKASSQLNIIATIGLALGLGFALLGLSLVSFENVLAALTLNWARDFSVTLIVFGGFVTGFMALAGRMQKTKLKNVMHHGLLVGVLLTLSGFVGLIFSGNG
jgi:hypothetical protein